MISQRICQRPTSDRILRNRTFGSLDCEPRRPNVETLHRITRLVNGIEPTLIAEGAVKKLCLLVALVFSSISLVPGAASAQTKPVQLGLVTPLQIVPEDQSVGAFRLCLIYCANEDVQYVDIGLVLKTTGEQSFVQFSALGLGNDFSGVQWNWAGAYNTGHLSGVQWSGLGNYTVTGEGVQLSGLFNYAEEFGGLQFALVNYAKDLQGLQVGLINIIANGGDIFGLPIFPIVNFDF